MLRFKNSITTKLFLFSKKIANLIIYCNFQAKGNKYILTFILLAILIFTVRIKGWIQPLEWMAFDFYFKVAPVEEVDRRIVIVGINEEDYRQLEPYYPIDDGILANLLLKIKRQSPMVIGLDLYRDLKVSPQCDIKEINPRLKEIYSEFDCQLGSKKLREIFQNTGNLAGIQRLDNDPKQQVPANQILAAEKRAFANNLIIDPDGVLRRGLLQTNLGDGSLYNFPYILAKSYLLFSGIEDTSNQNNLSFQGKVIYKFRANDGSYIKAEDGGYQILINWRSRPDEWQKVSLFDVLEHKIPSDLFTDKIVIIGSMVNSSVDAFLVPYYRGLFYAPNHIYGLEVQANITSQIISAVLDDRPLIKVLPEWAEYLTILLAIGLTVTWARWWSKRSDRNRYLNIIGLIVIIILPIFVTIAGVIYGSYQLFVWQRLWLPIVPIVLGIVASTVASITVFFASRAREYQKDLEVTNYWLRQSQQQLKIKNKELEATQAELVSMVQNLDRLVIDRTQELEKTVAMLEATQEKLVFENSLLKDTSKETYQYQIGGTLPIESPTYVVRSADRLLYKSLKQNQLCCIFNARQMGKSSLRVKMMKQLERENYTCVSVDLTTIGNKNITIDRWYGSFIYKLASNLELGDLFNFRTWWSNFDFLSPVEKLRLFIDEIVLEKIERKIIIFIDEIDSVLGLDFEMDDFFALIRFFYNYRSEVKKYQRLNFVLLGVATPYKLIKDHNLTPFNIGISIPLSGFLLHEVTPLIAGFNNLEANGRAVVESVLAWTGGQPFLTQKICNLIVESNLTIVPGQEAKFVAQLVQKKVIENWQINDDPEHLKTISNRLLQNKNLSIKMLELYRQILEGSKINFHDTLEMQELLLSGLLLVENGKVTIFNRIYATVFDRKWLENNLNRSPFPPVK